MVVNRVYIAGPMRGLPEKNYPAFNEVAAVLRKTGFGEFEIDAIPEVINPAENFAADESPTEEQFYELGLTQVLSAQAIVLLPGWQESEGALLEARVAKASGKQFWLAEKDGIPLRWWFWPVKPENIRAFQPPKIFPDPEPKGWSHACSECPHDGSPCRLDPFTETSALNPGYQVKDSGARVEYPSGMVRDTQEGKPDYTLLPYEFLTRWAHHMGKAIPKYGRDNWRNADSEEELLRFRSSAFRHLIQWLNGDTDEDHASAVAFNVAAAEYVKERLKETG